MVAGPGPPTPTPGRSTPTPAPTAAAAPAWAAAASGAWGEKPDTAWHLVRAQSAAYQAPTEEQTGASPPENERTEVHHVTPRQELAGDRA